MSAALSSHPARESFARTSLARALVAAGVVACASGLVANRMWAQLPAGRFAESLLLALLAAAFAWPLVRLRRWSWSGALALAWAGALVLCAEPLPVLAVALLAAGALAAGSMLVEPARPMLMLVTGLSLLAGLLGWLLPLPVHHAWTYAPLLVGLVAWRRGLVRAALAASAAGWRDAATAAPRASALGVTVIGLASSGAWLPTMQYDDLAYHLGLPWQLMLHGRYALDPSHQVWALAPWAGDVLQAVPQVVAGMEARGPLNVLWLLAAAAGLWRIGGTLELPSAWRWGLLALYASLPPVLGLQAGMQTETPAIAVTLALAGLVLAPRGRMDVIVAGLLFGLLGALKPSHALAALPVLALAGWRHRRASGDAVAMARLAAATMLAAAVAASSYTYAWVIAGNPVLPLLNGHFRSRYFAAVDFDDPRWHAGFGPLLPWNLTFATDRYYEAWPGGFGFVLVALAGAWLVALCMPRTRGLALAASLVMLLPLSLLQYARYALPGLVLLLPALVVALHAALPARAALVLLAGICALNIAYQSNANWMIHTRAVKRTVAALGRDEPVLKHYAAERVLAERIRRKAPQARVLDLTGASFAEFAGRGRAVAWYDPQLEAAARSAEADPSGRAWAELLRRSGASEIVLRPAALTPAQRAGLVHGRAVLVDSVGEAQWWRLPEPAP